MVSFHGEEYLHSRLVKRLSFCSYKIHMGKSFKLGMGEDGLLFGNQPSSRLFGVFLQQVR